MQPSGEETWIVALVVETQDPVVLRALRRPPVVPGIPKGPPAVLRVLRRPPTVVRALKHLPVVPGIRARPPTVVRALKHLPVVPGIPKGPPDVMMVSRYPRAVQELVKPCHAAEKSKTLMEVSSLYYLGVLASCFSPKASS